MMNIGEGDGVQPCLPVAASSWCCSYSSWPLGLAWLFGAHQNLPEHGLGAVGTASPTLSPPRRCDTSLCAGFGCAAPLLSSTQPRCLPQHGAHILLEVVITHISRA